MINTNFFVSDLHGSTGRYLKLFQKIEEEKPGAVFLGGDLLPSGLFAFSHHPEHAGDFLQDFLIPGFRELKSKLASAYPRVFLILGNDDSKFEESLFVEAEKFEIWQYIHNKKINYKSFTVYGYANVPPTPFQLKDWECFDVSQFVDPGCVSPEAGRRTVPVPANQIKYATIQNDLEKLVGKAEMSNAIFLFHTPPYQTKLDRAALDGKMIDHVPLDVHVGSIAVKRFIEQRQPLLTLHGHIHESARITGSWRDKIGTTAMLSAAHDGEELALVRFDLGRIEAAERELI
ncbi:MAG: hypothetical protein DWQ05_21750 [Calditrichaeota bacterium]|nr:MAG: hypothetical protein DWQ05_21750 [Calditrichota bacterium]